MNAPEKAVQELVKRARVLKPRRAAAPMAGDASMPSEDAFALAFVEIHGRTYRYVPQWHRWLKWDGTRWREDSTAHMYADIRELVRVTVEGQKAERSTANAAFVSGVERLLRTDQRIVVLPEQLDAAPQDLNTPSGIVDLRSGATRPHDPAALHTRVTSAGTDSNEGAGLWRQFLQDITAGDAELIAYLQRVAGYFLTGCTSEDVLVYLFGIGANGKSSFAEALAHALGDYAKAFPPEVLMESKGERHPTELAQFMGVRFALTSEPGSQAAWNDSRLKALTGDTTISARFMRGDFFTFERTHKTMVLGNHMPRLADVSHAIRRRVQMVPFRAVFEPTPGLGMRERLKTEAGGAILAWAIEGAKLWAERGTAPPAAVLDMTADYLADQDVLGQWLDERCERGAKFSERSSSLYKSHSAWCERSGTRPESIVRFAEKMVAAGFEKRHTAVGKLFYGIRLKQE